MDKPFDTQQMIDKIKKLLDGRGAPPPARPLPPPRPAAQAGPAPRRRRAGLRRTAGARRWPPAARRRPPRATLARQDPHRPVQPLDERARAGARRRTRRSPRRRPAAPPARPASRSRPRRPPACRSSRAPPAPPPAGGRRRAHVNGQMAGKLEELGLTPGAGRRGDGPLARGRGARRVGGRAGARRDDHQGRDLAPHQVSGARSAAQR